MRGGGSKMEVVGRQREQNTNSYIMSFKSTNTRLSPLTTQATGGRGIGGDVESMWRAWSKGEIQ